MPKKKSPTAPPKAPLTPSPARGVDWSNVERILDCTPFRVVYLYGPPGVGHIVDVPCLEWLAKQRGPRIWVSDGRVTGCRDQGSETLRRRSKQICRRARIHRAENAQDAVSWLRQRR